MAARLSALLLLFVITVTLPVGSPVDVLIRPDDVVHDDASPLTATLLDKVFRSAEFLYTLGLPSGTTLLALVPSHHNHALKEPIGIHLEPDHVVLFERGSDAASKPV